MVSSKVLAYTRKSAATVIIREVDENLTPTEVLIDVHHVGLNPGDFKLQKARFWTPEGTFGFDFSGTVRKVGVEAASQFTVGEKVAGWRHITFGSTEFTGSVTKIHLTRSAIIKQPKNLSDSEAAAIPIVYATALKMLETSNIDPDISVLVLGGGTSVGAVLIQLLKRKYKVKRVVASVSSRSVSAVRELGADETIDYRSPHYRDLLEQSAAAGKYLTIYDTAGGYDGVAVATAILLPPSSGSIYISIVGDFTVPPTYSSVGLLKMVWHLFPQVFRQVFGSWYDIRYKFIRPDSPGWAKDATETIEKYGICWRVVIIRT